jgi:hypothetical protein
MGWQLASTLDFFGCAMHPKPQKFKQKAFFGMATGFALVRPVGG